MANRKITGLGRGLDALIATSSRVTEIAENSVLELDINKIEPNREQPRKYFDEESLNELADSLKTHGMIQPVIVKAEDGYYTLIAGERRWRAARRARLATIPAIIKDYSPVEALQIALVENLQRMDLNPIEEALCYRRLTDEFFYTQESIAQKVGKGRHTISNAMGLLGLAPRVQSLLAEGRLSPAHGRALLSIADAEAQTELAERIAAEELSVRETERIIKAGTDAANKPTPAPTPKKPPEYIHLENELKTLLGTRVRINTGRAGNTAAGGKLEIEYYSPQELDRLVGLFKGLA